MRDLIKIGDFSRLGRVTVVALRHYADLGLLVPAHVDLETGYRYYTLDQLSQLHRILALKELGFSLEQVAELAAKDMSAEAMRGMLLLKRAELEEQVRLQQARLMAVEARLSHLEHGACDPGREVVLHPVAPQLVAAVREVVPTVSGIEELFECAERHAARYHARAPRPPYAIYHDSDYRERNVDIEVAVPLTEAIPNAGRVAVRELTGVSSMACVVHAGSYATIDQTSAKLLAWITARGYRVAGPYREVYLRFGAGGLSLALPGAYLTDNADEYLTELQVPIEPMGSGD